LIARHRLIALSVAILIGLAAGGQTPARQGSKPPLTDAGLENAIRQRFARSKCAEDKFTVRVQGGVATIEGKTSVVQRKAAATRMAKAAGARQVINKVEVSEAARQQASATLATGRRRAQVKRSEAQR
jgi:hypothetical protein